MEREYMKLTTVQNVIEKILMLSLVIRALKMLGMFLCVPFANRCLIYSDWAVESPCTAHQPDGIHPVQIHLIGIRDSPDQSNVRNKDVKFI